MFFRSRKQKRGQKQDTPDLIGGPVSRTLLHLTGPMVLAMLAMVAFNLIDTIYVGYLGKDELAAISFTFPVVFFFTGITGGIGIGATSIISRTLGPDKQNRAQRLTFDALALAILISITTAIIGLLTIKPLFTALNVDPEIFPLVKSYMRIWYFGVIAVTIPMVGNGIIRATGDTKTPMKIMLFAVFVNIVLDPILIFGPGPFPRLGLEGAAYATVTSRVFTMFLSVYVLIRVRKLLVWVKPNFWQTLRSWKDILYVGAPTALVNVLTPVSQGIVTGIVAGFGVSAVAGYGAATRLETFIILPIMAFSTALVPFIGQNIGAGQIDRVRKAISFGYRMSVIFGVAGFVIIALTSALSGRLFSSNTDVIHHYSLYIWFGGAGWAGLGMCYVVSNAYNALGKPLPAAVITLARVFVLIVPLALMGGYMIGIRGVFIAIAISNSIAAILAIVWLNRTHRALS